MFPVHNYSLKQGYKITGWQFRKRLGSVISGSRFLWASLYLPKC